MPSSSSSSEEVALLRQPPRGLAAEIRHVLSSLSEPPTSDATPAPWPDLLICCSDGGRVRTSSLLWALASQRVQRLLQDCFATTSCDASDADVPLVSLHLPDVDAASVHALNTFLGRGEVDCRCRETLLQVRWLIGALRIKSAYPHKSSHDPRERELVEEDDLAEAPLEVAPSKPMRAKRQRGRPRGSTKAKTAERAQGPIGANVAKDDDDDDCDVGPVEDDGGRETRAEEDEASLRRAAANKRSPSPLGTFSPPPPVKPKSRNSRSFNCSLCDVRFHGFKRLLEHRRDRHGLGPEAPLSFRCGECGGEIEGSCARNARAAYYRHKRSKHGANMEMTATTATTTTTCATCGKVLADEQTLRNHVRNIHLLTDKPFSCETCGATFKMKGQLKSHYATHSTSKSFICDECGFPTTTKSLLKAHQYTHQSVKKFACENCDKSFNYKHAYETHQRKHTGETPFQCVECGQAFASKIHLNRHSARVHVDKRLFRCAICQAQFKDRSGLKRHVILHSEAKPFQCTECGETFSHRETGRRHIRAKHPNRHLTIRFVPNTRLKELEAYAIKINKENDERQPVSAQPMQEQPMSAQPRQEQPMSAQKQGKEVAAVEEQQVS